MRRNRTLLWVLVLAATAVMLLASAALAQQGPTPPIPPSPPGPWVKQQAQQDLALTLRLVLNLAALSLLPAALITMTAFLRIIIVLGFLRSALGSQQTPPNTVLVGLALFLTLFVMQPVWEKMDTEALGPYLAGKITYAKAAEVAVGPLKEFMLRQTREKDLALFLRLGRLERPKGPQDVPLRALLPAFCISELKSAFQIGFVIYIPFIVIDLVVASALMSLGMLMLPPATIALPMKILLFVLIDGWHLIVQSLVLSFS